MSVSECYEGTAAPKDPFRGNTVFPSKGEKEGGWGRTERGAMRERVDLKASGPLRDYCLIALRLSTLTSAVGLRTADHTHTQTHIHAHTDSAIKTETPN